MLFFPEIFTSLTDPKTSIMFGSRSTMVTVVIRFRDDVSHNMHGYKINYYIMVGNFVGC